MIAAEDHGNPDFCLAVVLTLLGPLLTRDTSWLLCYANFELVCTEVPLVSCSLVSFACMATGFCPACTYLTMNWNALIYIAVTVVTGFCSL